jgi:exopolysaccharide production protein ExoZ
MNPFKLLHAKLGTWCRNTYELGPIETKRYLALEGLRGLAALLVFFVHFCDQSAPYLTGTSLLLAMKTKALGNSGVDIFFALSGFLIYGSLLMKHTPYFEFLKRRLRRLYPTFLFILVIYIALSYLFPGENKIPNNYKDAAIYIISNILLLPGIFSIKPIITVAWSLSYELFFYLIVPLLVIILNFRKWNKTFRILFLFALMLTWVIFTLPHPRMALFICGMIAFEMIDQVQLTASKATIKILDFDINFMDVSFITAALVYIYFCSPSIDETFLLLILIVSVFILLTGSLVAGGRLNNWLSSVPIRWLGNMSYSFYLSHSLALKFVFLIAHKFLPLSLGSLAAPLLLVTAFSISWMVGTALFVLIEKPFSINYRTMKFNRPKY